MAFRLRNPQSPVTAWLIPLAYAAGALIVGFTVPRLAYSILPGYVSGVSVNAAIGIYSAVASGMIALTGIVFSLTFVMVQFSATAYSPRLVLWMARDPVMFALHGCVHCDLSLRHRSFGLGGSSWPFASCEQ